MPNCLLKEGHGWPSNLGLDAFKKGRSTAFLGHLFHFQIALTPRKLLPMFSKYYPSCTLKLLHQILPSRATEIKLDPFAA